jgi:hypothetical protein
MNSQLLKYCTLGCLILFFPSYNLYFLFSTFRKFIAQLNLHLCFEKLQYKKEAQEMLEFAQLYMRKVTSPDQDNSALTQQDDTAPDSMPGDQ